MFEIMIIAFLFSGLVVCYDRTLDRLFRLETEPTADKDLGSVR